MHVRFLSDKLFLVNSMLQILETQMKKLVLAFALILSGAFSQQSKASFLIDPYIGYKLAWDTATLEVLGQSGDIDITRNGVMYGARAGYQFLGLMAGLEYGMGSGLTSDVAAGKIGGFNVPGGESSYDASYMGVFVGYELPIMLRAWATYFFDANWEDEDGEKTELATISLGVGFTGLPFVSLNAEYRINTFDGVEDDAYKTNAELLFCASIPLNL